MDAISPTATAKPTACTQRAPEIPTSPISAPPTAGPTRKPSDQTNDSADWPWTKWPPPTSLAMAPKAAASTNTRPAVTTRAAA